MLTDKKRKYIDARLSGLSLADSYRRAYDCGESNDATVRTEAYRLERDPDVAPMLAEGRAELAERAKWTRDEAIDRLSDVLDMASAAIADGDLSRTVTDTFFRAFDRMQTVTGIGKQTSDFDVVLTDMFDQMWH
jgi:hypothetical protein